MNKIFKILLFLVIIIIVGTVLFGKKSEPTKPTTPQPDSLTDPPKSYLKSRTTDTPLRTLADKKNLYVGAAVIAPLVMTEYGGCNKEPLYCQTLGREYNMVVAENAMKFDTIHPKRGAYDFSQADAIVSFAQTHNMKVRGHALVTNGKAPPNGQVPAWVVNGGFTGEQLRDILHDHINTVVSHFKNNFPGTVVEWDVVNEASQGLGVWEQIGTIDQVTEMAFNWAREADPSAKLYYNDDYGSEDYYNDKFKWVYNFVVSLKKKGVPIDGVGLQSHFQLPDAPKSVFDFTKAPSLSSLEAVLTQYANANLEVKFTELDVRLNDNTTASLNAQADVYGTVMTACLHISSCKGVLTWGFTDKYSWIPLFFQDLGHALPFDFNYNPKSSYFAMQNALKTP